MRTGRVGACDQGWAVPKSAVVSGRPGQSAPELEVTAATPFLSVKLMLKRPTVPVLRRFACPGIRLDSPGAASLRPLRAGVLPWRGVA